MEQTCWMLGFKSSWRGHALRPPLPANLLTARPGFSTIKAVNIFSIRAKGLPPRYFSAVHDQHSAWLLALAVLLAPGCRKEKDDQPPAVEILLPGNSATLAVPGQLTVRAHVSDDRQVESAVFMLTDGNGSPIAAPVVVQVGSTSATIERELTVTDERILSGSYQVIVRATAGDDQRQAFRSIHVQEAPLRLRAVFVAPPVGGPGPITRIDSTGAVSAWATVADLQGAAISSHGQYLYLADGTHSALMASPTAGSGSPWLVPNVNGENSPYFTSIRIDPTDRRLYVSSNDGFIRGFLGQGGQGFTAQAQSGYRPYRSVVMGDRLLTEQRGIAFPEQRLAIHTLAAGTFLNHWPLEMDLVDLFVRTHITAFLFGNRDGDGVVQEHFLNTGGTNDLRVFSGAPINAVARLNANSFAIALPDQVVRYDLPGNSLSPLAAITADALAYEAATGTLYIGAGQELTRIDPNTGNISGGITLPGPIGTILPLLNR